MLHADSMPNANRYTLLSTLNNASVMSKAVQIGWLQ